VVHSRNGALPNIVLADGGSVRLIVGGLDYQGLERLAITRTLLPQADHDGIACGGAERFHRVRLVAPQ
jgi:hypothetical protein